MKNKSKTVVVVILTLIISTSNMYPTIALAACLVSYILLGIYGVYIVRKN